MILAGLIVSARVGYNLLHQQQVDNSQQKAWETFVSAAAGQSDASASTNGLYLKMTIPKLNKDAVGVNGDWNSLTQYSLVHYKDSPGPGQAGNALVAFHRETHWLDINTVGAGDNVVLQTADGKKYTYTIDFVQTGPPSNVELLKPTTGNALTLITCDPPWQDYDRMMFRGHLASTG